MRILARNNIIETVLNSISFFNDPSVLTNAVINIIEVLSWVVDDD